MVSLKNFHPGRPRPCLQTPTRYRPTPSTAKSPFRRILDSTKYLGLAQTLDFLCVDKKINSAGLQIADLVARPIGIRDLRPNQENHAWSILEKKLVRSKSGKVHGYGLKIYPT